MVADNGIPQGRGMGSSAAAVVAGVMGAWSLCPDVETVDCDAVLRLVTELEGHPDNVAACLLGGATLSWTGERGVVADRLPVSPEILPVVLVPEGTLSTHAARRLLPELVPHADAAFNASRAALLVHALIGEPGMLLAATEDRLHQRQRTEAMPETLAAHRPAARRGARRRRLRGGAQRARAEPAASEDPAGDLANAVRVREVAELPPRGGRYARSRWICTGATVSRPMQQVSSP